MGSELGLQIDSVIVYKVYGTRDQGAYRQHVARRASFGAYLCSSCSMACSRQ
jgi:hypothetical protein